MSIDLGKLLRSAAACSVALGALTATAHAQSAGSWVTKAPVPAALNEVAVAYAGGKIHVLGGSVLGFTGPYHQEYDPATDKWRARAPLPRALDHIGSAVLNGKVYAVGGFVGGGVHRDGQNTAFEYDPSLDTWRILAPLKAGRDHVAAAAIDGKIHIAGGRFGPPTERTDLHDVYDPKANTWTSGPPLPTPRSGLAGTLYKGLFLVLGGELPPGHTFPENEAYDPKANSWRTLAPMPGGRHATAAATDGDHVYLAAGSLKPGSGAVTDQLIVFTLP